MRQSIERWARVPFTALALLAAVSAQAQTSVGIPGSYQSVAGCGGNWDPACPATQLAPLGQLGPDVWKGTFPIPAGNYEYKAALDGTWDVNYGQNAVQGGPNIPLAVPAPGPVRFYYSNATHWVTSNLNAVIATAVGDFQQAAGCPGNWAPDCLVTWLQDPDGDGVYTYTATLPAGSYQAKVAVDESWALNYGAGGVQDGPNIGFSVPVSGTEVLFQWDSVSHVMQILVEVSTATSGWPRRTGSPPTSSPGRPRPGWTVRWCNFTRTRLQGWRSRRRA